VSGSGLERVSKIAPQIATKTVSSASWKAFVCYAILSRVSEDDQQGSRDGLPAGLSGCSNEELLAALDGVLLELERRLLRYARSGPEIVDMADEGLVLAVRSGARVRQTQSAATHAAGHLQTLGVGGWSPRSTNPGWSDDPRVTGQDGPPDGTAS
jgi:hypothetical protein